MTENLDAPARHYVLDEDPARLQLDRVHAWLSEEAYWALGRSRATVERSFAGSSPLGVYGPDGAQAAVARIVSDRATFAWLCDVFVDPAHRGHGLGRRIAAWSVAWIEREGVPRILLATGDAHGVYATAGYAPLPQPERWMLVDRRGAAGLAGPSPRS